MTIDLPTAVSTRIEHALEAFFADRARTAAAHGPEFSELWSRTAEHARGGKLLRPRLFLEAVEAFRPCEAVGRVSDDRVTVDPDAAVRESAGRDAVDGLAAVLEILHYAFLLHDDVIDGDLVRRHRPNLIGTMRDLHPDAPAPASLHWGTSAAILMGDLLLSSAVLSCGRLSLPADVRVRVLDLVDEAITETVAGEHLDVGLSNGAITATFDSVVAMTTLKTATYSFALPLRLAGALASAGPEVDRTLADAGRDLGFAFQVQDDLLTMFGDHADHGKDVLSDLREGKETVLMSFLRTTPQWDDVAAACGDSAIGEADADRIRAAMESSGARAFAERLVAERLHRVSRTLGGSTVPVSVRRVVAACVESIDGRAL